MTKDKKDFDDTRRKLSDIVDSFHRMNLHCNLNGDFAANFLKETP